MSKIIPINNRLTCLGGLEEFILDGKIWPSEEYYEEIKKLSYYVGARVQVDFTHDQGIMIRNTKGGFLFTGLVRLPPQRYSENTYPHSMMFEDGEYVNLAIIQRVEHNAETIYRNTFAIKTSEKYWKDFRASIERLADRMGD